MSINSGSILTDELGRCPCCDKLTNTPANLQGEYVGHQGGMPFHVRTICRRCGVVGVEYIFSGTTAFWNLNRLQPAETTPVGDFFKTPPPSVSRRFSAKHPNPMPDNYYYAAWGGHNKSQPTNQKETKTMTKALYEVTVPASIDTDEAVTVFAHKLTTNSAGLWVMEEVGTSRVFTTAKETASEVMPYTIGVSYMDGRGIRYSFFAKAGDFAVGDLVWAEDYGKPVKVMSLDTKCRRADKWLTGWKLSSSYIASGE